MQLHNTDQRFGVVSIIMHWLVALAVMALFGLGFYMVDLDYYHEWYRSAPHLHRSVGLILFVLVCGRLVWRFVSPPPRALPTHQPWEKVSAQLTHWALYLLLLTAMVSGYLISTADGSSIEVFDWVAVPSLTGDREHLEDVAGEVHYWATWALVVLAGVHALAAIKHHVFDRDETLRRMLGLASTSTDSH